MTCALSTALKPLERLHLPPHSHARQRIWYVGAEANTPNSAPDVFKLDVRPDDHGNFASIASILAQLETVAEDRRDRVRRTRELLDKVSSMQGASQLGSHAWLMTDPVTYTVMRRISRESVYTAQAIVAAATLINEILARRLGIKIAYVCNVDRLDRPSLKVLARAMLLLRPDQPFVWAWQSTSDPRAGAQPGSCDPYLNSRAAFLKQLVGIIEPTLHRLPAVCELVRPTGHGGSISAYEVRIALVMQNYDACFLWSDHMLTASDPIAAEEGHRLAGLALTNISLFGDALAVWRAAENLTSDHCRRAHLCYLQGLVEAKRRYDLAMSNAHYLRGLEELRKGAYKATSSDLGLEHAWLLNGLALNHAVGWRRAPNETTHYREAFGMEQQAFALIRDGVEPERLYLRFNLLANLSFLLEMSGRYDLAIDTLSRAFDIDLESSWSAQRLQSTLAYRIGVLHYRAGEFDHALAWLERAIEQDKILALWATRERILRAIGTAALYSKRVEQAEATFREGLNICREERSAEGVREHGRGLAATLLSQGKLARARELVAMLREEDGISLSSEPTLNEEALRPSPPSPKLPAYIPEIDLEGIPVIDLNRFLGGAASRDTYAVEPWRN